MARYDYGVSTTEIQKSELPKFEKHDETALPQFTKDIPLRTIIKKYGSNVVVEFEWNVLGGEFIKISIAKFKNDDNFEHVHKIKIIDGEEVGSFKIENTTYIIRKTSEDIAKELMKISKTINASILNVIGYFKTVNGNFYSISKVESDAWSLDERLGLKNFSLCTMKDGEKRKFSDFILDELFKLYQQGYALRNFNLLDVIVTKKKIVFGNMAALIKVGASKTVDNLICNLKVLVKNGVAKKGDIVYGIALSFGIMKKEYSEWVKENKMANASEIEVLEKIEDKVMKN